jgi:hypothetical protein
MDYCGKIWIVEVKKWHNSNETSFKRLKNTRIRILQLIDQSRWIFKQRSEGICCHAHSTSYYYKYMGVVLRCAPVQSTCAGTGCGTIPSTWYVYLRRMYYDHLKLEKIIRWKTPTTKLNQFRKKSKTICVHNNSTTGSSIFNCMVRNEEWESIPGTGSSNLYSSTPSTAQMYSSTWYSYHLHCPTATDSSTTTEQLYYRYSDTTGNTTVSTVLFR